MVADFPERINKHAKKVFENKSREFKLCLRQIEQLSSFWSSFIRIWVEFEKVLVKLEWPSIDKFGADFEALYLESVGKTNFVALYALSPS